MKNREYIDAIAKRIKNRYKKYLLDNGSVDRSFFESEKLRDEVRIVTSTVLEADEDEPLSAEKFNRLYDIAIKESKHQLQQGMKASVSLTSDGCKARTWLDEERIKRIGWDGDQIKTYRARYLEYLSEIGRSKSYIDETDRSSLQILKKMGDPQSEYAFAVRGLVVGSVQSGKTANFNAVINSAIDVGYELIIVLSGIMEDLRKQTQSRIEKEVEGKYRNGAYIGVGEKHSFGPSALSLHKDVPQIIVPTSIDTDFKKDVRKSDFNLGQKNVLVCKKNDAVLKNLLLWLREYLNEDKDKIKVPLLILDDEADNASLNNLGDRGIEEASKINGHIRALLGLFEKNTYLGYTATPFGNILQDRNEAPEKYWTISDGGEDYDFEQTASLFPRDFIELLFPPPNYIGAKHFFETVGDDVEKMDPLIAPFVVDQLEDFPTRIDKETEQPTRETGRGTRATTKYDDYPKKLPKSLKEAVMCFVVSTAIRISRRNATYESKSYQPHNTMLIHISRFTTWQSKTRDLVSEYVKDIKASLLGENPMDGSLIYGDFERIWNKHYANIVANIWSYLPDDYEDEYLLERTFQDVKPLLISAAQNIEVKAINSLPPRDELLYPDNSEKTYIAIGGNRLSRGFTLEGLTINYFVRDTNYADTLLQMGRWFGYRPGYIDCCKLFSTADAIKKFDQTSLTIEDLEQKFIDMNRDDTNTPEKYALTVLTHPGVLKITRNSILKNAQIKKFSFSDQLEQTKKFQIDQGRLFGAWEDLCQYFKKRSDNLKVKLTKNGEIDFITYETSKATELFELFELKHAFIEDNFDELKRYIEKCNENGKLTQWTIAIKGAGEARSLDLGTMGIDKCIKRSKRRLPEKSIPNLRDHRIFNAGGKSANIFSGGRDFQIRLSKYQIEQAEEEFQSDLYAELLGKYPDKSEKELRIKVKATNIPEKVYRRKMSDKEGVLIIYLMDLDEVFRSKDGYITELSKLREEINLDIPLIGFAAGIPKVEGDIGASYLQSKFHNEVAASDDDEWKDYEEELTNAQP